jgi:hypothetical protein
MDTSLLYYFAFFLAISGVALYKLNKTYTIGAAFMLGWLFLPSYVFQLAEMPKGGVFPVWILGSSVPSLDWFSKAWVIPLILFVFALIFDKQKFQNLHWQWPDGLILSWCLWPLLQALFTGNQEPAAWQQSLYLVGAWAIPWALGRLYFSTAADQLRLIKVIALSCLLYLPVSIIEGIWGPVLHEYFYSANAFRYIGIERYVGFRPIGFLEDGNQFGAVIAITSVGAVWLARLAVGPRAKFYQTQALVLCSMALAAQSVGAIVLGIIGIAALFFWDRFSVKLGVCLAVVMFLTIGFTYVLTADIGNWMWNSSVGQSLVGFTKSIGRGSFSWRIWADQAALATVRDDIFLGTGNWAWWRQANIRPWGLPQLLIGQFGLFSVFMAFTAICAGAVAQIFSSKRELARQPKGSGLILSILLLLAIVDSLMNSFVYFPLLLIGGALCSKVPTISVPGMQLRSK